jgi:hypothetical protein
MEKIVSQECVLLNNKIILGPVFAISLSMFVGSSHPAYAPPPLMCHHNSQHDNPTDPTSFCLCDPGFTPQPESVLTPLCIPVSVGRMGIPIDSTSLLLAGVQGSALWMIPDIIIAGAGIGIVSFRKIR